MKASILTIGTELLIGQVINTNAAWMGESLNALGIEVAHVISISDEKESIIRGIQQSLDISDLVLITGGLGPTNDDITKKVLAEYLGVDLEFSEETFIQLKARFDRARYPVNESHRVQCYLPKGATLLENKLGTAPGMLFSLPDNKRILSMPGVPYEMKYIFENGLVPMLKKSSPNTIVHKTIMTAGVGETIVAARIEAVENTLPENVDLAYLPSSGTVRVRVSGKENKEGNVGETVEQISNQITDLLGDKVFGFDDISLMEVIQEKAISKGITVGTAESCTGGKIAHRLTQIPGSSQYYLGSIVAYDYGLKTKMLHVKEDTLLSYGAVSEETVIEMKEGLLEVLGVDVALSISGIAGPGGGTPDKPVGTVWMAVGNKSKTITKKFVFGQDRIRNIEYSTVNALNMLRKFLLEV